MKEIILAQLAQIEHELERWQTYRAIHYKPPAPPDKLDELFRASLSEVWQTNHF